VIENLEYRIKQVIPTVYDDSLSFVELLGKVLYKLNETIDSTNYLNEWLNSNGINKDYFDNLVKQALINFLNDSSYNKYISSINVLIYGADPTGVQMSANAIQQALDYVKSKNGGTVYIPNGTYLIEKKMTIPSNTKILMDKGTVLKRAWGGGFFQNGAFDSPSFVGVNGNSNITIEGGTLDGNFNGIGQYPVYSCDMMVLGYADNIKIKGVTFLDTLTYHSIDANGIHNLWIEDCVFKGWYNVDPVGNTIPREFIQIGEAQIFTDGRDTYRNCEHVVVKNCYSGKSPNNGSAHAFVGNHYSRYNVFNKYIYIENNTVEDPLSYGIRPYKWGTVKIKNNTINRAPIGIQLSNPSGDTESSKDVSGAQTHNPQSGYDIIIDGNTIDGFTNYGVFSSGNFYNNIMARTLKIKIVNNYFNGNSSNDAINFNFVDDVKVVNNTFNNSKRAMVITGSKNVTFNNNHSDTMNTEMFSAFGSSITTVGADGYYNENINVNNNTLNTCKTNAIFLQTCKNILVEGNKLYNVNTIGDSSVRGGVYVDGTVIGKVRNNEARGGKVDLLVNITSTCDQIYTWDNYGEGLLQIVSATCKNGYWSYVASTKALVFKEIKD